MEQIKQYFTYFFTDQNDLPADAGYPLFGAAHLSWLFFSIALITVGLRVYKKIPNAKKKTADRAIGISTVFLLLLRILVLTALGDMNVYELPLHLCSIAGLLCGLHVFVKWDWLAQVLYTLCLPGAAMALLFPNGVFYPAIHFITVQSFLFHAGIMLYILCQLTSGAITPRLSALWKSVLFLLAVVPPVYLFNTKFGTNYMFLGAPSDGSPLEWLVRVCGDRGYLWGYAALAFIVMLLMDIGYQIFARAFK